MKSKIILSLIGFPLTSLVIFFVLINSKSITNLNAVSMEENVLFKKETRVMFKKEVRQVEYFNSINIKGAYETEIVCQQEQSVEIQAPEDILTLVKTEVRDDILFIFPKNKIPKDKNINIKISAINLRSIDTSGANNIQVNNLKNKQTNINFDGSSNSKISGETEELNVTISGQANFDAQKFVSQRVNLDLSGSVKVDVQANEELNITMNGAGAIFYYGDPKTVTRNVQGPVFISKE